MPEKSSWKFVLLQLLILGLLLAAWGLRWEKGPVQNTETGKITFTRDRWLGQNWFTVWGVDIENGETKVIGGETHPYIPDIAIKQRTTKIKKILLASDDQLVRLRQQLEEAENDKVAHAKGHTEYIRLFKKYAEEYEQANPYYLDIYSSNWLHWYDDKNFTAREKIPQHVKDENDAWKEADSRSKHIKSLISEREHQVTIQAKDKAMKELSQEALYKRNLATYIWTTLIALNFLWLIWAVLFRSRRRIIDSVNSNEN